MTAAPEAPLVYAFSALLGAGAVVLLFVPILRHAWYFTASRRAYAVILAVLLLLALGTTLLVTFVGSEAAYLLPVAAVAAGLRCASPTLLYRSARDRFEARPRWRILRLALGVGYAALAADVGYALVRLLLGTPPPGLLFLSEQLVMAVGAAVLIVRTAFRFRPRTSGDLWPVWTAAVLRAVAFVVLTPYAFPAFAETYAASGLFGWIVGLLVLWRLD